MTEAAAPVKDLRGVRLVAGYVVVGLFLFVAISVSIVIGNKESKHPPVAGFYKAGGTCLGDKIRIDQSGVYVDLDGPGQASGKLRLHGHRLTGDVTCADGSSSTVDLTAAGKGAQRTLSGTVGAES